MSQQHEELSSQKQSFRREGSSFNGLEVARLLIMLLKILSVSGSHHQGTPNVKVDLECLLLLQSKCFSWLSAAVIKHRPEATFGAAISAYRLFLYCGQGMLPH